MSNVTVRVNGVGDFPAKWLELPFSLTCVNCDAGMGVGSIQQAALEGWRMIRDDDGPSWNFLGYCPDCGPECCGSEWPVMPVVDVD